MESLALLWVLATCCILMASVSMADTFSVCSNCNCKLLPGTLDGRVVDVPASIAETEWFVFNESIKSNATAVLLFRSVDPSCNVEIKLKGINSTVQFLVYPSGREDPTIASVDLGPFYAPCRVESPSLLSLGTSVVSKGTELAIAFVKVDALTRVAVDVQILYRQHCSTTRAVEGLPIAPPPLNGVAQPLQLANIRSLVPSGDGTNITWSIPPPLLSCAMKVEFNRITNSIFPTLNGLHVFVGITYRIPQGQEAVIRAFPSDVVINLEYRAVDCGAPMNDTQASSSKLQIESWNDVVKPLRLVQVPIGGDPWQTINVTLPDDDRHRIGIWFLSGPEPAYVPFTSWPSGNNYWPPGIPSLYLEDFIMRFNSTIMPGSVPFVSFTKDPEPVPLTTLTYAFLPAAANPMLVATANSSAPKKLVFIKDMLSARKIYIKSNNESCGVAVWQSDESEALSKIRLLPYGFESPLNHALDDYNEYPGDMYVGSGIMRRPLRSVGSVMGIQFYEWIDLETNSVGIFYQMACPIVLDTTVHPGQWHYEYFPSDKQFLLPKPPPMGRNQCRVDVSSVASALLLQQNPSVPSLSMLVTCLEPPMQADMLSGHKTTSALAACNGTLTVDVYSRHIPRNNTMFAYRVRCGEDDRLGIDDGMAPFLPMKKTFRADEKWKTLDTEEYEYENSHRLIWMLQARDPKCRVEISIDKTRDLASINILEDLMEDLDTPVFAVEYGVKIKHIRYVSCGRRVFFVGLQPGIGKRNACKYRQVCDDDASELQCTQRVTVVPSSDGKWNTLQATSNGNLNQLHQLRYHIASHSTGNDTGKLLELEFTSMVSAESWAGLMDPMDNIDVAETHSIWINGKLRATAGKQYLLRESADITVDSLLRTKRGDHLFTARYRLVDAKRARQEVRVGDVLRATNKAKTLEFKIPQQFSTEALQAIRVHRFTRHEDAYGVSWDAGDFPVWFFRHLYTIVPSNMSCSIALEFNSIDIGSGHFCGSECGYRNEQHRLSVTSFLSGTPRTSHSCISSSLDDPVLTPNKTICARMDRTYVTAPGSTLTLRFGSINVPEYEYREYEYERNLDFLGYSGPELTFGSGWTATYRQICDPIKAVTVGIPRIILVKARPVRRANDWQVGLPGLFQSNKDRLFRTKRWLITAEQPGCAVQYVVVAETNRRRTMPVRFQVGGNIIVPRANLTIISGNVTIIQLGSSRTSPITIKYRQMCTGRPTSSPTPSPIPVASRLDGDTCALDQQCASGICSEILLRCTSNTCSSQCASKNGNQTKCKSYAANGCSCAWSTTGSLCIPVT